ncbi:hypothetical protein MKX03_010601 [Papaver bracteatum]|nr:hypothetical protein MKX03_010601 [Papaver bracteatum]
MEGIMIYRELDKEEKRGGEETQLRFQILSLHPLGRCESSHSSAYDNRRQRSRSPQACSGPVTSTSTIVVKGFPKEATEEMIHQILAEWRPLPNIRVMQKKKYYFLPWNYIR